MGEYMRQRRVLTALAIPLVFAFVAASCGSDDSSSDGTTASDGTEATDEETTDGTEAPVVAPEEVDTSIVENTEEVVMGGSVTIGLEAEATGLRPWEDGLSEPAYNIAYAIYDALMTSQASGGYGPYLAESLEPNADFTVWTMKLRPDITFHNGTPLTAQTIVDMFPIQQAGAQGSAAIASATLTGVTAVDELTVDYTLSAPNSAFAAALSLAPLGMPFDPAAATADSAGYSINPIGTGPFVMKSRDIDNETVVERNPDYWRTDAEGNQLPYLDSISFRPIPDEGTRLDALLSGTVTAIQSLRQGTIRDARDAGGDIEIIEFQGNSTGAGHFNTLKPPVDDVRVRRGLNYMNNQDAVIEALGGTGISLPSTQWFSADDPYWTQEAADAYASFDFDAGKASLQEYIDDPARSDGKAPGEKIDVELSCPPDPTLIAAMQVIEQVWSGSEQVNVTLTQFDQSTHINNALTDLHQAHCWRFGLQGDPAAGINPFVADPEVSSTNVSNYVDPEMQAWALEATTTDDFETRKDLYSKIMVRINELALTWYSGGTAVMIAHAPNIKGINSWTLPSGELGDGIAGASFLWDEVFVSE
ncbi:MAG TPA: ABC transporter substrate-binding protein [Ilumatobacteraceae bacterium]|nr:ABC transporter substrate-binding protein [Ilumatobacteraceae bacterium]